MLERATIGILAVPGLLISGYFAAVYHKLVPDADRYIPGFCRIDPGACAMVLETSQARLFGVPNFDLGILFYIGLLGSALLSNVWSELHTMLFMGSIVTVVMGFYLSYVLIFKLRVPCRLCFASHAINLLIFVLFLTGL